MRRNPNKEKLLEELAKMPLVQFACTQAKVPRGTYYRWRKEDVAFAKRADLAIAEGLLFMNDIAEGQLLQAVKEKNITAIALWLKTHHPSYANKIQIRGEITHTQELSPEQRAVIEKAFRLADLSDSNSQKDE